MLFKYQRSMHYRRYLIKLYNGSGELAEKYGIVVEKYYNAFGVYNEERWE